MNKQIDIKNRIVHYYDNVNTGDVEDEVVSYLDKGMRVCFHDATFKNKLYVFTGISTDHQSYAITVNSYRIKTSNDKNSIEIG